VSQLAPADPTSAATAAGGLVLLVGGLALSPLALALARRIAPRRIVFFARWRFAHLLAVVLAMFLGGWIWQAALAALLPRESKELSSALLSVLALASAAVPVCIFAARLDPDGLRSLGFWRGGHLRAIGLGVLAYVLLVPAVIGLEAVWPYVWTRLGGTFEEQPILTWIQSLRGGELALAVAIGVLAQPFLEELLFRGFLQPLLVQNLGDRGGVATSAFVFATLHGASAFLPIFGLALLLGAVMLRTQRLAAAWAVHALHNGLMLALALHDPGGPGAAG
jgi:membrane protease YdiL (CAAX protease family)